ncbi:MAG: dockerin type I repeat-containing protein, partial [candidate division Zixibacteria bacterium]|nr:dockerin type I repeat-containing protein [candidate division Zixibacteria bacterium]
HPEYASYYVGMALTNAAGAVVTPLGCKDVRNAEYLYPQSGWGWQDSQLYRLAATPLNEGTVVDNPDSVVDRSVVMTAGKIPEGSTTNFLGEFILIESFSRTGLDDLKTNIGKARTILVPELNRGGVLEKTFPTGRCGDANSDGNVDAADIVWLVNYLYIHGPKPPWIVADVNSDAAIDAADIVTLVNYLYIHGPAPDCEGL